MLSRPPVTDGQTRIKRRQIQSRTYALAAAIVVIPAAANSCGKRPWCVPKTAPRFLFSTVCFLKLLRVPSSSQKNIWVTIPNLVIRSACRIIHAKTEFVRKWDRFIFTEVLSFGSSPQPARCGMIKPAPYFDTGPDNYVYRLSNTSNSCNIEIGREIYFAIEVFHPQLQ